MKEQRIRQPGVLSRMIRSPKALRINRRAGDATASETMKAAVQAALVVGTPASQIAIQYNLPTATVKRWEEAFNITNPVKRRDRLSEMLMIFLEQEISSLLTISIATQDERWIKRQTATELAAYVATKQDRVMRILEAYGKAEVSKQTLTDGTFDE